MNFAIEVVELLLVTFKELEKSRRLIENVSRNTGYPH